MGPQNGDCAAGSHAREWKVQATLTHTGTGWRVDAKPDAQSYLQASHLPGKYRLLQFHAHWGQVDANCL